MSANVVRLDARRAKADASDELVLVKPGNYNAVYDGHRSITVFRTHKVRVDFRLLEHPGLTLPRWYRVTDYRGRIRAGAHSDIVRELSAVLGRRLRHDRIPVGDLANKELRVQVATVTADSRQRELATINRYSVITRILECVQ